MIAAGELHPAVADRLLRADPQPLAVLGGERLVRAAHQPSDQLRLGREVMRAAPPLQRERRAGMAQQVGVQRLQHRKRLEPARGNCPAKPEPAPPARADRPGQNQQPGKKNARTGHHGRD